MSVCLCLFDHECVHTKQQDHDGETGPRDELLKSPTSEVAEDNTFILLDEIGSGAFGQVFAAVHKIHGNCAIKVILGRTKKEVIMMQDEVNILAKVPRHGNLISIFGYSLVYDQVKFISNEVIGNILLLPHEKRF